MGSCEGLSNRGMWRLNLAGTYQPQQQQDGGSSTRMQASVDSRLCSNGQLIEIVKARWLCGLRCSRGKWKGGWSEPS